MFVFSAMCVWSRLNGRCVWTNIDRRCVWAVSRERFSACGLLMMCVLTHGTHHPEVSPRLWLETVATERSCAWILMSAHSVFFFQSHSHKSEPLGRLIKQFSLTFIYFCQLWNIPWSSDFAVVSNVVWVIGSMLKMKLTTSNILFEAAGKPKTCSWPHVAKTKLFSKRAMFEFCEND